METITQNTSHSSENQFYHAEYVFTEFSDFIQPVEKGNTSCEHNSVDLVILSSYSLSITTVVFSILFPLIFLSIFNKTYNLAFKTFWMPILSLMLNPIYFSADILIHNFISPKKTNQAWIFNDISFNVLFISSAIISLAGFILIMKSYQRPQQFVFEGFTFLLGILSLIVTYILVKNDGTSALNGYKYEFCCILIAIIMGFWGHSTIQNLRKKIFTNRINKRNFSISTLLTVILSMIITAIYVTTVATMKIQTLHLVVLTLLCVKLLLQLSLIIGPMVTFIFFFYISSIDEDDISRNF